jgi:hypothetical protein
MVMAMTISLSPSLTRLRARGTTPSLRDAEI